ncbi:MAG: NAD(P)H-dependent oxidoreductase subunit E [Candidatus Eremiobacteraeota bacterium]|nr:NAD(P)H-dependent oxidoreductase subunit E [Candidatus Eremiobacteraeota bacterium]
MDLHFTSARASEGERAAVDAVLGPYGGAAMPRTLLLPVLHALREYVGWISEGAVNYVGERLSVAPADVYGVATFYALFSTKPRAQRVVHVCDDIACMDAGSERIVEGLESSGTSWLRSPCLGLCDRAPAALIETAGDAPTARAVAPATTELLDETSRQTRIGGSPLRLLRRVGTTDAESLEAYRNDGGYCALSTAFELGRAGVIAEIVASKLLGRGGAAFPTGRKMEAVAAAPARPHYLVCNADESEPGTFKDRVLMEDDPFAIVEAMTIAGYAVGCEHAYIYIRGEYPLAAQRVANAAARARASGLLGENVMGSGWAFDLEIRRGAGAYICGEETALFNSIEGKRGEPRNKPPFPVDCGLFGKPTLVNNVETLVNLPIILRDGAAAYAATGTPGSTGTRLFCLAGAVARPGLYEVAHGTTLGALIDLAGGVRDGARMQAILLGGAAGTIVTPQAQTMPLTFEDARAAGATLGSGVVMLFDEHADMAAVVRRIAQFFRDESCGQCVPCRVGTVRQAEALQRLSYGNGARERDILLLGEIGSAMRDASICGLGQTAANAVESAQRNLRIFTADAAP